MTKPRVIWKPLAGSQALALTAPCDHILYEGTRGPGKTDCQLMRFRMRVGQGYGAYWRGIIFDRQYKSLDDLVAKSKKWFPQFGDGARFLSGQSSYKWVWPTGEELHFRVMEKAADYDKYHGHEYCLWEKERIHTPSGLVAIKDLKVGDKVLTPAGYRKVNRKFNLGVKECVKASIYTSDGLLHSVQRQSAIHQLLTTESGFEKPPLNSFCNVPLFDGRSHLEAVSEEHQPCDYQENQQLAGAQANGGISSKVFGSNNQSVWPNPSLASLSKHQQPDTHKGHLSQQHSPKPPHGLSIFSVLSGVSRIIQSVQHWGQVLLSKLLQPTQVHSYGSLHAQTASVPSELHTEGGSHTRCYLEPHQYGEPVHRDRGTYQFPAQPQPCVQGTSPAVPLDVLGGGSECSPREPFSFAHPYTGKPVQSVLQSRGGFVYVEPCESLPVYDIEVDDVNCYITEGGLVNKNCFIGWNELCKYPTLDCYDLMMSCNRSSFIPSEHSPDKANPLPKIPLEVFSTANPHGVGHNAVKRRFITPTPAGKFVRVTTEVFNPQTKKKENYTRTQVRIFGSYRENKYLDPAYIAELENISDPNKRAAWLHGDWDITAGGALDDIWRRDIHILPRFVVPKSWKIVRSFDWGSTHPFSVGWWAVSNGEAFEDMQGSLRCFPKGTLIRISELYGSTIVGKERFGHNKGRKLGASDLAVEIIQHEETLKLLGWIQSTPKPGPADNQINNVNEKESLTIAALMKKKGVSWTSSDKSKGTRKMGLELLRNALLNSVRGEGAGLYATDNCEAFIETVPGIPRDEKDPDDVDTTAEDHVYDDSRYMILDNKPSFVSELKVLMPT